MAGPSQNIELEAAKFLHKLIQDSKDEPAKLATKLFVILQHMKSSGKESTMPFQVISRAMETVINQHGLDIEALKSSRLPMPTGAQGADSATSQFRGPSPPAGAAKDSNAGLPENELPKMDPFSSSKPPVGPSGAGHEYFQGPGSQHNSQTFDHESPSSLDSRSGNSQSQEMRETTTRGKHNKKEGKKNATKRKRGNTSEPPSDNAQQSEPRNTRKGKINKVDVSPGSAIKAGEHGSFNVHPSSNPMEQFASMSGSNRPTLRPKQESQHFVEKPVEPASSSMSRGSNIKLPEGSEVNSTHSQQMPSVSHENVGLWNQNKSGLQFENPQVPRFSSIVTPGPGNADTMLLPAAPSSGTGSFGMVHGSVPIVSSGSFPTADPGFGNAMQFGGSNLTTGKGLEHDGGASNKLADSGKMALVGRQNSASEMSMLRNAAPRDTGKSPVGSGQPFREQQLKQLRAQCLVFLAFRNGLIPKKMHLDIALGSVFPKEDGPHKELVDQKGKVPFSSDPNIGRETDKTHPGTSSTGRFQDTDSLLKEADEKEGLPSEDRKQFQNMREPDVELQTQHNSSRARNSLAVGAAGEKMENGHPQGGRIHHGASMMGPGSWNAGGNNHDEISRAVLQASSVQQNLVPEGKDNAGQVQSFSNMGGLGNSHPDIRDRWKPVSGIDNNHHGVGPFRDANTMTKHVHQEQREEGNFMPIELSASPKYTMSEKWILDHQQKKHLKDQKWLMKQQKTRHRIATCFYKLKENANSSEDISAKTKSVIELKKLQLLELQRRLRSDFLNDFFKPIYAEVDRLKSCKKHKHGRRVKQLEKFEQKMKEERQKRIRERQKEFFSEIEAHKERLDDVFKFKRERLKGFNKYAKEFHKKKERIHREKIDRIQREKINLLKINDVEGYLRMVQDAKSDRVKQLLKETEKYLQKLGSKLQQAKTSRCEGDESGSASLVDKSETAVENEDESDQAKHYLESNEKYYLMAHSVKESIAEQPNTLQGGTLREYQMNGLRWLVSLYNNHLNGILADEMGLGKTVQVISLICYLMEAKNDRGPFLVVVPSSVLPGWASEIEFWAPTINKIVYSGPPEERRKLFKERIVHQKFNVLLTTYEYLMNKHDRPKLSKIHWHYVIIDEGHRIKNASCKLNADLKYYQSSHRLLLTGTPLQNNLEELWALLNFLLPNIFNSSEDFSQWFNKPFESNGDNSADQALLSEEENLLIINRLHQVLRPFVLRRLKHKVENELPEKIERLIRCEASAYQKVLMKRVEDNLGAIGSTKSRSVHNSVMELRNICNHPYLSQLHADQVDNYLPKHYLPPIIRHCGKLEMLDRLLPKLKAADHRILFFSTMTRLLDVMEEYLHWKQYRYLRLDGHTSGGDRGGLIDAFNKPDSPYFIFLLSIRAGGVGVNLQAADTVIIFDTDWNPQVDLQAQARAHRIGQKRDVLVLRFETVQTVEEQVRASAEHKLGVANQSITAGFFDNNTSAEDRREYLEALLRECKKEEAAPVLDDDALNDILARSGSEIDVFESVDKQRREAEMATWRKLACAPGTSNFETPVLLPPRLVTEDDLKEFTEAMKIYDVPKATEPPSLGGIKRKGAGLGGADTQHYGRGKRTREVRSYEEQWTEEEFEKLCQAESPDSPSKLKEEIDDTKLPPTDSSQAETAVVKTELPIPPVLPPPTGTSPPTVMTSPPVNMTPPASTVTPQPTTVSPRPATVTAPPDTVTAPPATVTLPPAILSPPSVQQQSPVVQPNSVVTPPPKRGRGRPKRVVAQLQAPVAAIAETALPGGTPSSQTVTNPDYSSTINALGSQPAAPPGFTSVTQVPMSPQGRGQGRKNQSGAEAPRRRGKRQVAVYTLGTGGVVIPEPKPDDVTQNIPVVLPGNQAPDVTGPAASVPAAQGSSVSVVTGRTDLQPVVDAVVNSPPVIQPVSSSPAPPLQTKGQSRKPQSGGSGSRRRGRKQALVSAPLLLVSAADDLKQAPETKHTADDSSEGKTVISKQDTALPEVAVCLPDVAGQGIKTAEQTVDSAQGKQSDSFSGPALGESQSADICKVVSISKETLPESISLSKPETSVVSSAATLLDKTVPEVSKNQHLEDKSLPVLSPLTVVALTPLPVSQPAIYPAVPTPSQVSQSTTTTTPVGPAPGRRSGRKTPVRTETPRRRGRRSASALTITPDSLAIPDPRLSSESPSGSAATLGAEALATDACLSTVYDPKKKDQSSLTSQAKQPTISPASIDSAKGRIQTTDVSDVARVMKEMFSGTRSSRSKTAELTGKEGKGATSISSSRKSAPEVAKNPIVEEKVHSGATNMDMGAPGFPLKYGKHSPTAVSNETMVKQDDTVNLEINTGSASDKKIDSVQTSQEDLIRENSMKPNRGQTSEQESTTVDSMETSCGAPLVGENHAAISHVQPLAADPSFSSATSMELDVKLLNDSENKTEPLAKAKAEKDNDSSGAIEPHVHGFSSHGGLHVSNEHDIVSGTDNSGPEILLASVLPSMDSEPVKSTSETIIEGPEPLSKSEDLGVGSESAVAKSQDSNIHDASSSGRNQDHDVITKDHVSSMQVDQIEGERQNLLVNSDAGGSSSMMADGEKCDALESSAVPEEPKGSPAECDDKLDVPTSSDCSKVTSEKGLPVEEEQKIGNMKEKGVIFGLSPLEPSKSCDANTVVCPEKALEPSSLLLMETEKATSSSLPSETQKDSEVDMNIQLDSSAGQPVSLEDSEVQMPAPLDSSSFSGEKVECPSQMDKIHSRDSPQVLISASERILDGDSASEEAKAGIPPSELTGEEKIISSAEQDLPNERKEKKAEEDDQPMDSETSDHNIVKADSSEVGGVLLETVASDTTGIQLPPSVMEDEIVEGVTVKGTEEAEREIIADEFNDRDCPVNKDSKTLDLPCSSLVSEEETIDGSARTIMEDLPVQPEESKDVETEKKIITDALDAPHCPENKDSQLLDLPSSSSVSEEARVVEEESKVAEAGVSDQVQVYSVATETEKQEATCTESPGQNIAGKEESKIPEAEDSEPMDVCEAVVVEEKRETDDSVMMDACEAVVDLEKHGADDELKMDDSQSNDTLKEIIDERSSKREIEEIEGSSERYPAGSPVLDKVDLPLSSEKNDEVEASSEKLQADCPVAMEVDRPLSLEKPEEIGCTPEKLQASSSVSDNVDLPSSSKENEEMESEKHRSSSPVSEKVDMPLSLGKIEDEKPQLEKVNLPLSVEVIEDEKLQSEKLDLRLLEKNNEIEGTSEKLQPSSPVSEKVATAVSLQITEEIVGMSEEHESGSVDLPSSSGKNEEIDGKSETEQSGKLDFPLPLEKTEEIEGTSKKEESEEVDLPLEKTEEIEGTSEKEDSEKVDFSLESSEKIEGISEKDRSDKVDLPLPLPLEKTEDLPLSMEKTDETERVDTSVSLEKNKEVEGTSEKADMPLSLEKTEENAGSSEKRQKNISEMAVSDERDTSKVTKVLPDTDVAASSAAKEEASSDKNADPTGNSTQASDGKGYLSGDAALEGGAADESDASKVLDNVSGTMDAQKSTQESSVAQAKGPEDSSSVVVSGM